MHNIKSFRYLLFVIIWILFWIFTPLFLVRTYIEGPLNPLWLVGTVAFMFYGAPKVTKWLVQNTAFRHVWA